MLDQIDNVLGYITSNSPLLRKVFFKPGQRSGNTKILEQFGLCFDEKISEPVTCTGVSKGEIIIKLSGVSATDSVLESSRKTGLDLVYGDVDGNVVTV